MREKLRHALKFTTRYLRASHGGMHNRGSSRFHATVRRRKWTDKTSGAPLTNVLMDGGCLYVPGAEYGEFLDVYSDCIGSCIGDGGGHHAGASTVERASHGEALYVVERPSVEMRFYADFDVHLPLETTTNEVEAYVTSLVRTFAISAVSHLDASSHTIALGAELKRMPDKGVQKLGIHLIMPHTRVRIAEAEDVRTLILADIEKNVTPTPLNGWTDAFDASVYRQGGLRMFGSRKMVPCGCTPNDACTHRKQKVDAGRPYLLRTVVDAHGNTDDRWTQTLRRNTALCTRMTSIRLSCDDDYAPAPKRHRRAAAASVSSVFSAAAHADGRRVADMILGDLEPQHRDLIVVGVVGSIAESQSCLWRVEGEGSRFCPHVGRRHTQSTIYFVVSRDGVALRCHCKKGGCPAYRGRPLPLSRKGAAFLGLHTSARGLPPGFS